MEKNKKEYLILVLVICVLISFGGGYFFRNNINNDKKITDNKSIDENIIVTAEDLLRIQNIVDGFNTNELGLFYKYYEVDNKYISASHELYNYVNSLDNFNKIIITNKYALNEINEEYKRLFGKIIDVKKEDSGYIDNILEPFYIYDNDINSFKINDSHQYSKSDYLPLISDIAYYNCSFDNIKYEDGVYIISYYGLYENVKTLGPSTYFNKDNSINSDEALTYYSNQGFSAIENYINNQLVSNKDKFLKIEYLFEKNDNSFYLVDFREV